MRRVSTGLNYRNDKGREPTHCYLVFDSIEERANSFLIAFKVAGTVKAAFIPKKEVILIFDCGQLLARVPTWLRDDRGLQNAEAVSLLSRPGTLWQNNGWAVKDPDRWLNKEKQNE